MAKGHRPGLRPFLVAAVIAAPAWTSSLAVADSIKGQCADANASAQMLRRDGKLSASREQLMKCSDPKCPAIVRDDCARRLDELDRAQPTVVFEVKDSAGVDVLAVSVTMDGQPWAALLEGKALPADPGQHVFVLTVEGHPPITRTLLLVEGEKGRGERVDLKGPSPSAATPPPAPTTTRGARTGMGTQKILGLAAGGVGVVGVGLGAVFGLMSGSAWTSAKSACGGDPSRCTDVSTAESHRSTAETDATISTAGFITGGVLLAAGVTLFLTAPHPTETARLVVSPAVGPGQAGVAAGGVF